MALNVAPHLTPVNKDRLLVAATTKKGWTAFNYMLIAVIIILVLSGTWRLLAKAPEPKTMEVVAAAQDLPPGCRISFESLHYFQIPVKYWSDEMATSSQTLVGRYTRAYIPAREPILNSDLLPGKQALAPQIQLNERAVTLKLPPEAAVDYGIRPGDRVDVIANTTKDGKKYTKTICQNRLVLFSVTKEMILSDQSHKNENDKITLSVSPEDAEKLAQAMESSKLMLTLRNPQANEKLALAGADDRDLLPHYAQRPPASSSEHQIPLPPPPPEVNSLAQAEPTPQPQPLQWIVDVFSGSERKQYEFPTR